MHRGEHLRIAADGFNHACNRTQELLAELRPLRRVVVETGGEILADPAAVYDASAISALPCFLEYLVERDYVGGIALMLCEPLVNDRTVRVAERDARRLRCEACPDDLSEPHALFSGELQDLGDIGDRKR